MISLRMNKRLLEHFYLWQLYSGRTLISITNSFSYFSRLIFSFFHPNRHEILGESETYTSRLSLPKHFSFFSEPGENFRFWSISSPRSGKRLLSDKFQHESQIAYCLVCPRMYHISQIHFSLWCLGLWCYNVGNVQLWFSGLFRNHIFHLT